MTAILENVKKRTSNAPHSEAGTLSLHPSGRDVLLFTGNYGSGKTEVSVNVVRSLALSGEKVLIADLDLVNPYFRCREAREPLEELGVRVVAPEGGMHSADLPIVLPEVQGAIERPEGISVLDVGGDNVGATVLASLTPLFRRNPYEMYFVLNRNRPFTDTVEGALRYMDEIEQASRLSITAVVGNTHLMEETDLAMARAGAEFALEVAGARGIPVAYVTAPREALAVEGWIAAGDERQKLIMVDGFPAPVLPLKRIMLPPWLGGPAPGSMATHARDNFARLTR